MKNWNYKNIWRIAFRINRVIKYPLWWNLALFFENMSYHNFLSICFNTIHGINHFLAGHYRAKKNIMAESCTPPLPPPFSFPSFIVKKWPFSESWLWPLMVRWPSLFHVCWYLYLEFDGMAYGIINSRGQHCCCINK